MPMPWGYRHAEKAFKSFIADARDRMGLNSDNMTYTAVDAVFQVFRRRLSPRQVMAFGDVLPELLRALWIYGYDPATAPVAFADRAAMTREAQAIRPHHNLTPDNAIAATAWALRRHMRQADLDRVLAGFGPEAREFWQVAVDDPRDLDQRII